MDQKSVATGPKNGPKSGPKTLGVRTKARTKYIGSMVQKCFGEKTAPKTIWVKYGLLVG